MKKQDKNVCKSCSGKSPWKRVKKVEEEEVYDHDLLFRFCCLAAVLRSLPQREPSLTEAGPSLGRSFPKGGGRLLDRRGQGIALETEKHLHFLLA